MTPVQRYADLVRRCGLAVVPTALSLGVAEELGEAGFSLSWRRGQTLFLDRDFLRRLLDTHASCAGASRAASARAASERFFSESPPFENFLPRPSTVPERPA